MKFDLKSYARNLMELANQEQSVDLCYSELKLINDEINRDDELAKMIVSGELTLYKEIVEFKANNEIVSLNGKTE